MRIEPALARYHSASDKTLSLHKTGVQCLTRYIFLLEKLIFCLFQNHFTCKADILTQCECLRLFYENRVSGRPVAWPKFYRPKMGKKLTTLNRYISVITNIAER